MLVLNTVILCILSGLIGYLYGKGSIIIHRLPTKAEKELIKERAELEKQLIEDYNKGLKNIMGDYE